MASKIDADKATRFALSARMPDPVKLTLISFIRHGASPRTVGEIAADLGWGRGGHSRLMPLLRHLKNKGFVEDVLELRAYKLVETHPAFTGKYEPTTAQKLATEKAEARAKAAADLKAAKSKPAEAAKKGDDAATIDPKKLKPAVKS